MTVFSISPTLQRFTNNQTELRIDAATIGDVLPALQTQASQLASSIIDQNGQFSPYVNLYLNGKSIKTLSNNTPLQDHDTINIISSLVGG